MKKSVYSLMLSDEVVEAIDRLAYSMGTNRSNLINQLLAERVAYITPEKRIRSIFSELESLFSAESFDNFQLFRQPSDSMLSLRSALKYKYNPTIRYGVELYRESGSEFGELRVSFRTSSARLISDLNDFLAFWIRLEKSCLSAYFSGNITSSFEDGRFTRRFLLPEGEDKQSSEIIGRAVAEYIKAFDKALKLYFSVLDDHENAERLSAAAYSEYLKQCTAII